MIFVSYVELLYRLASDLALKTKYYSTLFSIRNLSEIAFFLKKRGNFCFVLIMRLRGIVHVLVPRTSRTQLQGASLTGRAYFGRQSLFLERRAYLWRGRVAKKLRARGHYLRGRFTIGEVRAQLAEHWASIPKVVGSLTTVGRHIFQACPV